MTRLRPLSASSALAALVAALPLLAAAQAPTEPPPAPALPPATSAPAPAPTTPPVAAPAPAAKPQRLSSAKFQQVDTNQDGTISREEAAAAPQLAGRFDELDTDRDGRVSPTELKGYAKTHRGKGGFDKMDSNQDGVVTRDEVGTNPRLMRKFEAADADRDGRLTATEADAAKRR